MKTAILYFRKNKYYIQPHSQTVDGAWIGTPPIQSVEAGHTEMLGAYALNALNSSTIGISHPTEFESLIAPLLEQAGVKTWAQFVQGTASLMIEAVEEQIRMTPYANHGARDGFDSISTASRSHEKSADPMQVGQWIIDAFKGCE